MNVGRDSDDQPAVGLLEEQRPGPARRFSGWLGRVGLLRWLVVAAGADALLYFILPKDHAVVGVIAVCIVATTLLVISPEHLRALSARGIEVNAFGLTAKLPPLPAVAAEEDTELSADDLIGLRLSLERKLTYLAKHLLGRPSRPAVISLGSLVQDGRLTVETARTCAIIDSLRVPSKSDLRGEPVADWLVAAQRAVAYLRVEVMTESLATGLARHEQDGVKCFSVVRAASVPGVPRAMKVRLLAAGTGGEILVVPVFSFKPENTIFRRAAAAATKSRRPFILVVPPNFSGEPDLGSLGRAVRLDDAVLAVSEALQV